MTSKEALYKLEKSTNWSSDENIDKDLYNLWGNVACRAIKKDLDRLEKLERIFEILQRHLYVCSIFIEGRITTEKNFRECLSNCWTKFYNGMKVIDEDYYELYDLWNELLKEGKKNDN